MSTPIFDENRLFFITYLDLLDNAKALCYTLFINLIEARVL